MFDDLFSHNSSTDGILGLVSILGAALFLMVAIACSLVISLDAERRNLPKWGAFTLVLILFPISVVIWFLIRGRFQETEMFNYATAEILAKQSGRPNPSPKPVASEPDGTEPEKRKIRIIEEEDYADAGERSSQRRRRRSSSSSRSSRRHSVSNRCRKCRHRISSSMAVCPHCGTKQSSE